MPNMNNRYKTKLCENYKKGGYCQFGNKCSYAHGKHDLRILNEDEKDICWFFNNGNCANGDLCPYLHEYDKSVRKPLKLQKPCFEYHIYGACKTDSCGLEHYPLTEEEFNFHFPYVNIELDFNWQELEAFQKPDSPDWGNKIFYKHPVDNVSYFDFLDNECNNSVNVSNVSNDIPYEVNILVEKIMCAAEKLKTYAKQNPEIYNNALNRLLF